MSADVRLALRGEIESHRGAGAGPGPDLDPVHAMDLAFSAGEARLLLGEDTASGERIDLPVRAWTEHSRAGDTSLLRRCTATTLDIGCGPGRLTAALARRGVPALGIDVSTVAVALARSRGAAALRRDVFTLATGSHRWRHVLLADGNIGIGGDPVRLLCRCRELLDPRGSVLLDVADDGIGLITRTVRLVTAGRHSVPFRWSWLDGAALGVVAEAAGLAVRGRWRAGGRQFAELGPDGRWFR